MTTSLIINKGESEEWLATLSGYQGSLIQQMLSNGLTEDQAAALWLSRASASHTAAFGGEGLGANLLASIKSELHKMICGDAEYEDIRQQAAQIWAGQKYAVVALLAGAIALKLGFALVAVTPVVALILSSAGKVGLNVWCNTSAN